MDDIDAMYQQIILDAAHERHGEGILERFDGESLQVNTTCGDQVNLQVKLSEDGTQISAIGWDGHGCSISQASISIMTEMLEGKSITEAMELYDIFRRLMDSRGEELDEESEDKLEDAGAFVGVAKFPMRIKCALLGWMALRDATDKAVTATQGGDNV
ncbi:MAG: SUF system NifU family Fe-S cluster assembly protein [Actinomycetaceae bacterium]|jgi:nitrogen fixation NifU-like protein|nr:SUF system NifU family Fe-S cluster assembly protein [Actinomycetaceae bacterium]